MRPTAPLLLTFGLVAACASTPRTTAPQPTPAPPDAAAAPDAAPAAPATPAFSVEASLPEGRGVILAERPGGTVTLHPAQGPDLQLADGEAVTFVDDSAGVGGGDATATVEARGVRGAVPNARVVTEARLRRGPDGHVAVYSAIASCGDLCHAEVWLFGPTAGRAQITSDAGPDVAVAWSPDGSRVAIGSGSLYVVTVADGRAGSIPDVTAPAWAPDGALFARGSGDDDAIFEVAIDAAPRRVYAPPGRRPPPPEGTAEPDPTPVTFEQGGRVLRASFRRAPRDVIARVQRDGTGARVLTAAAAAAEDYASGQMEACNRERRRGEAEVVFPPGSTATALRAAGPTAQVVRIERPGAPPVEVVVDARARQIRSPRGPTVALPGGLDVCPGAVWLSPRRNG